MDERRAEFGATIAGPVADGGVLASDRRASLGDTVSSRRVRKAFEAGDRAGLAFTGGVAGAQALIARLENERRLSETRREWRMSVGALAALAGTLMRE